MRGQTLILNQVGNETPQTLSLYPQGVGTGLPVLSGLAYVLSANAQGATDGAIEMSCAFASDENGLTWATQP